MPIFTTSGGAEMKWNRIKAIIKKDIKEVTANKMVIIPMIIVPLILCIVVPLAILIVINQVGLDSINGVEQFEKIIPFYSVPDQFSELTYQILYIFLNFSFLPFFMIIPLMVSSIIAANSIVGEKERKTLETLLYTPVTNREFLQGKLLSSFIPAFLITLLAFITYFVIINLVSFLLIGVLIVRSLIWIPAILLLSPAVSLLGLSVTLLVSLKAKTFMEAQQTAGIIVLPFVALVIVQITGVVIFKPVFIVVIAAAVFILSYLLISRIGPRFNREKIIATL